MVIAFAVYSVFAQGMFALAVGLSARYAMHRRSRWWVTLTVFFGPFAMLALLIAGERVKGDPQYLV